MGGPVSFEHDGSRSGVSTSFPGGHRVVCGLDPEMKNGAVRNSRRLRRGLPLVVEECAVEADQLGREFDSLVRLENVGRFGPALV